MKISRLRFAIIICAVSVGSVIAASAFSAIYQLITYTPGSGPEATVTLPLGTIVPEIADSKIFDDAISTNDYAGSLTINFESSVTTWQVVFTTATLEIYGSDGISGTVTGSPVATIDIITTTTTTITVSASQEYDYKLIFTPVADPIPTQVLQVKVS